LRVTDIIALLLIWICCSVPLVLFGSFLAIKNKAIKNPGKINHLPLEIKPLPWFLKTKVLCLLAGILPFGYYKLNLFIDLILLKNSAIFIELVYIMASIWRQYIFYLFGFLFIVMILLLITCSEISILLTYVLLCK